MAIDRAARAGALLFVPPFALLSIVPLVAIVVTGRYPPFSLAEKPDYPATVDIEYPERLSHGLVVVRWWLPAILHYLVLAILVGGGA